MSQTWMEALLLVLAAALAIAVVLLARLSRRVAELEQSGKKTEIGSMPRPFSEPRPGPKPVPPVLLPAMPVVPVADPNIRPTRFAYDQAYFERFYAPSGGKVLEVKAQVNDEVKRGDVLLRLELGGAQSELRASASGKLRELNCQAGTTFRRDQLLYVIQ